MNLRGDDEMNLVMLMDRITLVTLSWMLHFSILFFLLRFLKIYSFLWATLLAILSYILYFYLLKESTPCTRRHFAIDITIPYGSYIAKTLPSVFAVASAVLLLSNGPTLLKIIWFQITILLNGYAITRALMAVTGYRFCTALLIVISFLCGHFLLGLSSIVKFILCSETITTLEYIFITFAIQLTTFLAVLRRLRDKMHDSLKGIKCKLSDSGILTISTIFVIILIVCSLIISGTTLCNIDYATLLKIASRLCSGIISGDELFELHYVTYLASYLSFAGASCRDFLTMELVDALLGQGMLIIAYFALMNELFRREQKALLATLIFGIFSSFAWIIYLANFLQNGLPNIFKAVDFGSHMGLTWSYTGTQIREFRPEHISQLASIVLICMLVRNKYEDKTRFSGAIIFTSFMLGYLIVMAHHFVEAVMFSLLIMLLSMFLMTIKTGIAKNTLLPCFAGMIAAVIVKATLPFLQSGRVEIAESFIASTTPFLILVGTSFIISYVFTSETFKAKRKKVTDTILRSTFIDYINTICDLFMILGAALILYWIYLTISHNLTYSGIAGPYVPMTLFDYPYIFGTKAFLTPLGVKVAIKKLKESDGEGLEIAFLVAFTLYLLLVCLISYILYFFNAYVLNTSIQPHRIIAVFGSFAISPLAASGFEGLGSVHFMKKRMFGVLLISLILFSSTFTLFIRSDSWLDQYQYRNKLFKLEHNDVNLMENIYGKLKGKNFIASSYGINPYTAFIVLPTDTIVAGRIITSEEPFPIFVETMIRSYRPEAFVIFMKHPAYKERNYLWYVSQVRGKSAVINGASLSAIVINLDESMAPSIPALNARNITNIFCTTLEPFDIVDYAILDLLRESGTNFSISTFSDLYALNSKVIFLNEDDLGGSNRIGLFFDLETVLKGRTVVVFSVRNDGIFSKMMFVSSGALKSEELTLLGKDRDEIFSVSKSVKVNMIVPKNHNVTTLALYRLGANGITIPAVATATYMNGTVFYVNLNPLCAFFGEDPEPVNSLMEYVLLLLSKNVWRESTNFKLGGDKLSPHNLVNVQRIALKGEALLDTYSMYIWNHNNPFSIRITTNNGELLEFTVTVLSICSEGKPFKLYVGGGDLVLDGFQGVYLSSSKLSASNLTIHLFSGKVGLVMPSDIIVKDFKKPINITVTRCVDLGMVVKAPVLNVNGGVTFYSPYIRYHDLRMYTLFGGGTAKILGNITIKPVYLGKNNIYLKIKTESIKEYVSTCTENANRILSYDVGAISLVIAISITYAILQRLKKKVKLKFKGKVGQFE